MMLQEEDLLPSRQYVAMKYERITRYASLLLMLVDEIPRTLKRCDDSPALPQALPSYFDVSFGLESIRVMGHWHLGDANIFGPESTFRQTPSGQPVKGELHFWLREDSQLVTSTQTIGTDGATTGGTTIAHAVETLEYRDLRVLYRRLIHLNAHRAWIH